ncbi:DUF4349 domain-containing protein [Altererythrobacter xixiisoli]|uniref:DUF4349 domain-containing protein n=1 Tax=Croceibacterium xixiisoli TaxID=1476466 RepID=A0A6I4TVZ4_9SPHN|nr:DUF4349 domain-containing protein [Croceibacterium xixiisoli]MXO99379.1 DUF4349 domain-containing protein [Croceibacterium xixiisoli]
MASDTPVVGIEAPGDAAASEAAADGTAAAGNGAAADSSVAPASAAIPLSIPKIAYVFNYSFRLADDALAPLQQKHADLCEAQGPLNCRIISLTQSGNEGSYASGRLELAVASDKARMFGDTLTGAAINAGGEQTSATIEGEDLSKQMVDTEARLQSRIVLRDRLMEVLKTRRGEVSELVEAERGVAQVSEEIDQARSWLQEMRGRVSYSRVSIEYESTSPAASSFFEPIRMATGSLGSILGSVIAVLMVLGAILGPLLAGAWGIRRLSRRFSAKPVG